MNPINTDKFTKFLFVPNDGDRANRRNQPTASVGLCSSVAIREFSE